MRFARGPFWLGSISKLTRSPPARESKFTLESRPVRWKKYSFPSSAAMNPNPRSDTNFLIVPVGISKLLFSKVNHANARVLSRRIDDRGEHRSTCGRRNYLTTASSAPNRVSGHGAYTHQKASNATPTRVATAPDSLNAVPWRSRSLHTPQTATATTAVSRTGATTESGAMLKATRTSR